MSETHLGPARCSSQTGDIGDSASSPCSKSGKTGSSAQTFPGRASSLAAFPGLSALPQELFQGARQPQGRAGTSAPTVQIRPLLPQAPLTSSSALASALAPEREKDKPPTPFSNTPAPRAAGPGPRPLPRGGGGWDEQGRDEEERGEEGRAKGGRDTPWAGTQRPGAAAGRADARARGSRLLLRRRRAGDAAAGRAPGAPRSAPQPRRAASGHPRWAKPRGGDAGKGVAGSAADPPGVAAPRGQGTRWGGLSCAAGTPPAWRGEGAASGARRFEVQRAGSAAPPPPHSSFLGQTPR